MAGSQNISRMSPRQKMINLMYIVLTAMLALNVSSDVLDGFNQVQDSLTRTNANMKERNDAIYDQLVAFNDKNPEKGGPWYNKATQLRKATHSLYSYIDSLKLAIVKTADGDEADINNIQNVENLDAASVVMLAPNTGKGGELRRRIDSYRTLIAQLLPDKNKVENISHVLVTEPRNTKGTIKKTWEEGMFEDMPVIAAITLLTKVQNDVRYSEGEALGSLLTNIDAGDVRVNRMDAFVIPQSINVMRGTKYSAHIVLAAVDSTQRPIVYINGQRLNNDQGLYEVVPGKTGEFTYSGYIEVPRGDGTTTQHPFQSKYNVIEPAATVSATMMNVLYAGINNPISIAVPGVPPTAISATMTNGTLTRNGDAWVARPAKIGAEAVVTVTANINGSNQTVATTSFRVRKLPDPTPYIPVHDDKGNPERYKGQGRSISKQTLVNAEGLKAAIDDDLLNVEYRVISFETVVFDSMGNAIPEVSAGASFSQRQKDSFRRLSRGKRFYISRVKAVGPDGIERVIAPMEVMVN